MDKNKAQEVGRIMNGINRCENFLSSLKRSYNDEFAIMYRGYEIWCKNCNGSGKLHNPKQSVMAVCKVKVRRLIASIWEDQITIKYKVDGVDEFKLVNVRNRGENNLFKTEEEAEKYCVDVNTKEISGEF